MKIIVLQFLLLMSLVNCNNANKPITNVPVFSIKVNKLELQINQTQTVQSEKVNVRIERLVKLPMKSELIVRKDSDPNFYLDLSEELKKEPHEIILETALNEGGNLYTFRGTLTDEKGDVYVNEFFLDLRTPQQQTVRHMGVLEQSKFDRLNIAIKFKNKILPRFSLIEAQNKFLDESKFSTNKKPDIFIIFFDTLRKDKSLLIAPNMREFQEGNVTPAFHLTSGTSTVYSLFSMFHTLPAFLTYGFVAPERNSNSEYGSFPLKILKKVGYKLHVFGRAYECLKKFEKYSADEYAWPRMKQSFFGVNSELLESCTQPGGDTRMDPIHADNWDDKLTEEFIDEIKQAFKRFPDDPQMFFVSEYNVHNPYRWRNLQPKTLLQPSRSDISFHKAIDKTPYENRKSIDFTLVRNNYDNSVKFSDLNFKKLIDYIDSTPRGNNSIVLLMSDHGELLGEKDLWVGHGNRPYRERIDGVMSFRFEKPGTKKNIGKVFSTMDIFPTLIDYLGIEPKPKRLMMGTSILASSPRTSAISVRSSGLDSVYEIVISNDKYKVFLTPMNYGKWKNNEDSDRFYTETTGFIVFDITNTDDRPVFNESPFSPSCDVTTGKWSSAACKEVLMKVFGDGLKELFPDG